MKRKIDKIKEKKIIFEKYSALGNDYIVIDPNKNNFIPQIQIIKNLCNRNFGIGSDGLLLGPIIDKKDETISIRIFNSDGSEAEKSGNGLRIFTQYLLDAGYIINRKDDKTDKDKFIKIRTVGGIVKSIFNDDGTITIDMGKVRFYDVINIKNAKFKKNINFDYFYNDNENNKFETKKNEESNLEIEVEGFSEYNIEEKLKFKGTFLTIGNPHFVIILNRVDETLAKKYGKSIESNPIFLNKTNVQFVQVLDKNTIKIEIYERGSGYTLSSGSSACAAAAVSYIKGLTENNINVVMQGGILNVLIDKNFNVMQTGKVKYIFSGSFFISTFLDKIQN
ncbi:MAG: diaminopimelate epimerase [Exilispira sp.]